VGTKKERKRNRSETQTEEEEDWGCREEIKQFNKKDEEWPT